MPYQITLPDGSIGLIADSVPKDRAMEAAQAAYPDAFPGIGEQLLGAPAELAKGFARGFVDPVSGLLSTGYTGLRAAGMELEPFAETAVGKGLAGIQESLAPEYGTVSEFAGALGGLGSFIVPGAAMAKGLGRAATLGGMATGLGAEEARSRVEQARMEGIEVTPGQEFGVQLGGTVIGLTELAPIERLTGPLQAVLRGVKKSDAEMIAPGLFNSAKRMLETGGIEGLQEGMANVAQDLFAKGVYNPNLDVGESAMGDAAMGASVGAFAQGVIELATKGRRRELYDTLKAEESAKAATAEAEKSRLAEETARKEALEGLGVQSQPLLLAAPQAPVEADPDDVILNPFTPFSRQELDKEVVKELDKRREEAGRPKTETFTVQDIADTGVYRGELNRLMAQRSGFTGETRFKPSEIIGLAQQKNIETSTQGFSDLVSRVTGVKPRPEATGIKALQGLNDVELFTVREAINKLPTYEQKKILPTGKTAKIFDDKQANKTLTSIKKTLGEELGEEGLGETSVLKEIGDFSGLEDINDQKSLLEKYIADGELDRISTPAFAVLDANGKQVSVVRPDAEGRLTQKERAEAKAQAQKIGGSIKDTTINQIYVPTVAKKLLPGLNIKQGVITDESPESYDIVTTGGVKVGKARSLTEAEAKKNRAIALRKEDQQRLLEAKQELQTSIAKDEQTMSDLEALGRKESPQFQKIQNSMAAKERNLAKIEQKVLDYNQGVTIKGNYKKESKKGYTLFDADGNPAGTFNSKTEALESSVVAQPTPQLEKIIEAYPSIIAGAKGVEKTEAETIYRVATDELNARLPRMKGERTRGIGVSAQGDLTAAEERLALQGIFSPRIKEKVNELDKKLRGTLDKLGLKDVRLNIVGAIKGELGVADGAYAARLIKIAFDAENPMRVLRHEGIHALKELGAFTPDQWRVLENKAKSEWLAKYNIIERYQGLDPASMLEEAISDAFSDFSQTKPPAGMIGNIFSRLKDFFTRLDNAFKGLGFQTADDVFGRVERGELLPGMGERAAEVEGLQAQRVVAETPERYALKTVQDVIDDGIDRLVKSALKTPSGFQDMFNDRYTQGFGRIDYNLLKIEEGIRQRLYDLGVSKERDSMGRRADDQIINDILYRANQKFKEIRSGAQPTEQYSLRKGPRILKNGQIVGSPPNARTVPQRTALVREMTNLLRSPFTLLDESKNWYEDSGAAIREITRGDPELTERVVRLMALYSQANGVGGNTTATIRSIYQLATGQPTAFAGRFPNVTAERIPAILAAPTMDDSVPGVDDKLMNFYRNLHDATYQTNTFDEASTIDRWMMRLFGYPHNEDQDVGGSTGLSKTQYDYAKDLINRIGDAHFKRTGERLLPRQIQAALWTYVKNKTEYDSLSPEKQKTFEPSIIDFSDYITRATANITWETRPSTSVDFLPGIHKAPRQEQESFNKAVRSIFEDEQGNDLIFQLLGGEQLYSSQFSIGAYENQIAPNIVTRLVLRKDEKQYLTDAANKYASIVGYVTKQDAVPWYRADPTAGGKLASVGYRVTPSVENVDADFEQRLFDHLNEVMPGIGFTRVNNSFDFVNFRGEDGKPYFLPDKKYKSDLQNALESFPEDIKFNVEPFRAESAYIFNDWKENTNGEGYLSAFSPGELANIRDTIDGWRSDYDRIGRDYAKEFGWDTPKYSLRGTNTLEFREWFGRSKIVDEQGRPRVMYHGTARDITEFKAKQAGAIFVTEDPRFAEDFSYMSEMWMIDHADQFLSEQEIKKAVAAGVAKMAQGMPKQDQIKMLTQILQFPIDSVVRDPDATEIRNEIAKRLPSKPNILPVYVRAERPFDFENQEHLEDIRSMPGIAPHYQRIRRGEWSAIEEPEVQEAIQDLGFDGFYVKEGGKKNLAVYRPDQLKSVTGNIGTYGQREPTLEEAKQFGLTVEEAKAAQKRGDIRYSLRVPTTPEFKQWSRNAPFVSPENSLSYDFKTGKPFVAGAYHGTNTESDFVAFDIEKGGLQTGAESAQLGIFSTSDPTIAENYASNLGMGRYLKLAMQGSPELKNNPTAVRLDKKISSLEKEYSSLLESAENEARKNIERRMVETGMTFEAGSPFTKEMVVNSTLKSLDLDGVFDFAGPDYKARATKTTNDLDAARKELSRFIVDNEAAKIPQRILPLFIRMKNPMVYDAEGQTPTDFPISDKIAEAKRKGHDGVVFKNIADPSPVAVHYVTFKPDSDIKSGVGNIGIYGQREPTEAEAAQFGMTKEEAKAAQKRGDIRYSLRQQAGQTLGQNYLDTVQRTTTPREEKTFKQRMAEAISPTKVSKFRQMFINKYEAIEVYSRELAKKFGDALLLADVSAISAALMSDRAAGVAAESFKSGIPVYNKGYTYVDNMGGKVKGLMEVLMPLAQKKDPFVYQMFQDYAARRRGVRLDAQGKTTPFSRQELAEIPKIEKAFPEFKQVFEDYQKYNEGLVRFMRDTGVIDAKAAQEWMKYGDYIPFYRQLEGERTVGPSIFSAISGVKAPKKLKGGEAPLGEFLETVVRNSKAAIEAGMRNVAANRVVTNFQRLNSPSGTGRLVERTTEKDRDLPDVVTVRENGKDAYYKVADPLLVQSMQALNIPHIPGLDILAKPAEFLREMVTRDPAFIGASVLRESLSAWITTGQKLTPVADGVKQFTKILANASPTVQNLRKAGIGSGYEFKGDVQSTSGVFADQLKRMAGDMTAAQRATQPVMKMWDALDKASTAADLSTRAAVFERVMQETGNEAEAVYQAMEVINFSRKGSSPIIQIFAAIIPFLNARIQGLDLLYRAGFGRLASANKVTQHKAFMLRSLALLGTTAMYYALVQDEEEWQRADQETRDNYWILGGFKFPIPFELGVMFKVIPERIMAYTMGDDTGEQVRASIARQVMGTLSFNPIPQAVLPLIEASANYSFFLQRDIVGMGKKDLAPEFQTSEGTSQIAIQLGQALGLSPMKIDYVLRGYTGAMGTYAISTMDSIIRSEDDATKAAWRLDQIPVLKRFMISDLGAGTVNEYYDLREKLDEVVRTSNQLERTGNVEALTEYLKENGQVLNMKDYIRALDKDMKELRESRMAINMSRMEPQMKRESLDALRRAEIALTERINVLRKNMGV